jgi:hypothetical protein
MSIALWIGGTQTAGADPILFHQPATAPGGYASQLSPDTHFVAADDFTLDTGAFITSVQWQGAFSGVPPSNITKFVVTFWNDSHGLPGVPLQTYIIPGNAGQTLVGTNDFGFRQYDYGIALPTPFTVHNGVTSWISVQPTTDFLRSRSGTGAPPAPPATRRNPVRAGQGPFRRSPTISHLL